MATAGLPRFLHRHTGDADTASSLRLPRYLQAKRAVSQPGDASEQQADRVAEQVMRLHDSAGQALIAPGGTMAAPAIQRKSGQAPNLPSDEDASMPLAGAGTGHALDPTTRAYFEPRFGVPFDTVRIHTDTHAAHWNRTLGARAFAYGNDIFFAAGRTPGPNALTAHELTHVTQQQSGLQAPVIQRAPDNAATDSAPAQGASAALISDATQAIEKAGGNIKFLYAPAELEGNAVFILFEDIEVQRLFRYLLREWFGTSGISESLENTVRPGVPKWVGEFRAKALNLRSARAQDADYAEQRQLADLAVKLADSVEAETPAQSVRRRFVEAVDKRIGTTVMTQEAIDKERAKPAEGGLTPKNFTTCIAFFGQVVQQVMQQSGVKSPLVQGPNHYKEIDPVNGKENLPPGAWHPSTPETRPKPGDLLIFSFAKAETLNTGVKVDKGWFAHISILRAIEPLSDPPANLAGSGYTEKFISVDGGGTKAAETVRYFAPATGLIQGPGTIVRTLKGWIDVEKVAEARLPAQPPVQT